MQMNALYNIKFKLAPLSLSHIHRAIQHAITYLH